MRARGCKCGKHMLMALNENVCLWCVEPEPPDSSFHILSARPVEAPIAGAPVVPLAGWHPWPQPASVEVGQTTDTDPEGW